VGLPRSRNILDSPLPAPIFRGGTALKAIFMIDGVFVPMLKPSTQVIAITTHRGVSTLMPTNGSAPARLPVRARIEIVRGSKRSIRRPASGALSKPLPYRNRVTKPNCAAVPPGRLLMKKASEYTTPLKDSMCSQ